MANNPAILLKPLTPAVAVSRLKVAALFVLAVTLYGLVAMITVADNGFQNGDEDINMLLRGDQMYADPSSMFEPDETGRNNVAAYLLLGGMYRLFGFSPFPFYALLLILHIMVSVLLVSFSRRLWDGIPGAAVAGLFFLVLSVHFQTIGWIENLGRVSMTLLCSGALILFDDFRKRPSVAKIVWVYGLWFVGLNFAEEGVVFPFLILAYDLVIRKSNPFSRSSISQFAIYIPFFVMQLLFFLFQSILYGDALLQYVTLKPRLVEKILGIFWTFANLVVPRREALAIFTDGMPLMRVLLPFVLFIPLGYFLVCLGRTLLCQSRFFHLALFAMAWFLITFLPYCFRPLEVSWKEYPHPRYLYWPMMGAGVLVGWLVQSLLSGAHSLNTKSLRLTAYISMALAGMYFYTLNVWTYCFMVEKLCAAACVDQPPKLSFSPSNSPSIISGEDYGK